MRAGLVTMMFAAAAFATHAAGAAAPTEKVIVTFEYGKPHQPPPSGADPSAGLVSDASGALYGTTDGGAYACGNVFRLTPPAPGSARWTEDTLHSFSFYDGCKPEAELLAGPNGSFFGTTAGGGPVGHGTVFQLTPPAAGGNTWTHTIVYSFQGRTQGDGDGPFAGLVADGSGALYGTTLFGGTADQGTVFRLTPPAAGGPSYVETVLFSFGVNGNSQVYPQAGVTLGRNGALYGTLSGTRRVPGAVFRLTPPAGTGTTWRYQAIHDFTGGADGATPLAGLIEDAAGNLFGTTFDGGSAGCSPRYCGGTAFELSPPGVAGGVWTETILHAFAPPGTAGADVSHPWCQLLKDAGGALFGTTYTGPGSMNYEGTVFKLTPPSGGGTEWSETVLHTFGVGRDFGYPRAGLVRNVGGGLYGTTSGVYGLGTVFKIRP